MTDKETDPGLRTAAAEMGRKGGSAGRGSSKRRSPEHYRKLQKLSVTAAKIARETAKKPPSTSPKV